MRKFGLVSLLKDIETLTSEANQIKDLEEEKKPELSPVRGGSNIRDLKPRRPRRSRKNLVA